ncbi:MAG: hypothetical protein LBH79_03120 [Nitrososphaerota archaeon]|nr:hypothetical protein [Nitrososphaerota archaeon]
MNNPVTDTLKTFVQATHCPTCRWLNKTTPTTCERHANNPQNCTYHITPLKPSEFTRCKQCIHWITSKCSFGFSTKQNNKPCKQGSYNSQIRAYIGGN